MVGGVEQSARLVSFELVEWRLIWKERRAETQHMECSPPSLPQFKLKLRPWWRLIVNVVGSIDSRRGQAYTAKNAQPVQGWWKQPWTTLCCPYCSMFSTLLFSIVEPELARNQVWQCWTILLTTLNNVGSTTLFKAVFIDPEQVVRFYACILQFGRCG